MITQARIRRIIDEESRQRYANDEDREDALAAALMAYLREEANTAIEEMLEGWDAAEGLRTQPLQWNSTAEVKE